MKIHWMDCIVAAFLLLVFVALTPAASAGTIAVTPPPVASGPGLGLVVVPAIVTPNPNNDNRLGGELDDNNLVIPLKRFDSNDYIDLLFTVIPSDGVTEYKVTEFVDNNTGINWSSYKMQLGFGTGAAFTLSGPADGLDFDAPEFLSPPGSPAMPLVALGPDELNFSGGSQGSGRNPTSFDLIFPT